MSTLTTTPVRTRSRTTVGLIFIIAAVVAALAALDILLENAEESETQSSAEAAYQAGQVAFRAGHTAAAIEDFRKAHAAVREDETYELALIGALMNAGRYADAEPLMKEVLERNPDDGPALLVAARLQAKKGKPVQAAAFYHRAIYGAWPRDAREKQIEARIELVEFLKSRHQTEEMLAELILLQEEAGEDQALLLRTADLFLLAGSPKHAESAYRKVISLDPRNPAAYAGLGEVELETGDYRQARSEFVLAKMRSPADQHIQERLDLAKALEELDPTSRRLPSVDKYRKSIKILQLARDDFQACLTSRPAAATQNASDLMTQANSLMPITPPAMVNNELAENVLDVAQQLWQTRIKDCGLPAAPEGDLLRLIMEKLAE
jgi:tetratricopeptide (TPR) repeat protein